MILFTKPNCKKCDWLKKRVDLKALDVLVMELTPDDYNSLAELAWYEAVNIAQESLPILVLKNHAKIKGVINIRNYLMGEEDEDKHNLSANVSFSEA
jgi:hypothetical protein